MTDQPKQYSVEMPSKIESYGGDCFRPVDVLRAFDQYEEKIAELSKQLADQKDRDELYKLPSGIAIDRHGVICALQCNIQVSNEACRELLRLLEQTESELTAERDKTATIKHDAWADGYAQAVQDHKSSDAKAREEALREAALLVDRRTRTGAITHVKAILSLIDKKGDE